MPRPVVIEGQLTESDWSLSPDQHRWISKNCDTLLHNAASLQFIADETSGEPWLSNLTGTQYMLDLASRWNIRHLHHVSTAYVCGLREGRVYENQIDVGQTFGNDYEASKCASENLVNQRRDDYESVTVHRPAIITGDYNTGYTSTFHGLYAPLKIAASLFNLAPSFYVPEQTLVGALGLGGKEEKNFVPVDWVSEAMASILVSPGLYGRTYHLTSEYRTPCSLLAEVMHETFAEHVHDTSKSGIVNKERDSLARDPSMVRMNVEQIQRSFRSQMEIYQAYWRDDPVFDRTETTAALPNLPPPPVDRESVRRLCRFALRTNFGWPRPKVRAPKIWADEILGCSSRPDRFASVGTNRLPEFKVNLHVLGEGGGEFHLSFDKASRNASDECIPRGFVYLAWDKAACGTLTMSTSTLADLFQGRLTLQAAIRKGAVVCVGGDATGLSIVQDDWVNATERWLAGAKDRLAVSTPTTFTPSV